MQNSVPPMYTNTKYTKKKENPRKFTIFNTTRREKWINAPKEVKELCNKENVKKLMNTLEMERHPKFTHCKISNVKTIVTKAIRIQYNLYQISNYILHRS